VVVIKKLLQTQANEHCAIITQMAKLMDFITVPAARASILWLLGEYSNRVPKIAPDVLRKLAKSFIDEEDVVKLQVLNLAVKLYLTNPSQTELLCQYVFNLARYDQNYDIRDRARFLKQFIFPTNNQSVLAKNAKSIFLAPKPAPTLKSNYCGREKYQLGSLSHFLNIKANGYTDLPEYPTIAPDSTVRDVQAPVEFPSSMMGDRVEKSEGKHHHKSSSSGNKKATKGRSFYSESEKSSSEDEDDEVSSSEEQSGSSDSSEEKADSADGAIKKIVRVPKKSMEEKKKSKTAEESSDGVSSGSNESGSESDDSSDSESDSSSGSSSDDESSETPVSKMRFSVQFFFLYTLL
jgi:AP-3 complex subunit beta